ISDYSVFELPNPYRLVIDVRSAAEVAGGTAKTPSTASAGGPSVGSAKPAPAVSEPAETALATAGPVFEKVQPARPNQNGSHSLTRALGLKIGRIVLDPGHGGHDTGTIGPTGLHEKDLVLDLAQRLGQLITERLGSEVILTREVDAFLPLEARTALANEREADLFLSIHANASRSKSARGIETYYLNFTTDPEALEVAARENAVSQETISQLQTLVQKIALADKVDESREFATRVHKALANGIAGKSRRGFDRGVKKAPFVVLIGANMPSVLAEVSFLSNPQDEKSLRTSEYRQKIAEALFSGIESYVKTLSGVKVARTENAAAIAQQ
ncbi:MAG: N-acetylmuramoyl-L-alanine amidase, partial [Acidobacteria bacterium]|nr:N-acetylmuramoyl-L-alanine amidase [Acidobacteriota bacterium]